MNKTLGAIVAATALGTACAKAPQRPATPVHDRITHLESTIEAKALSAADFIGNPEDTTKIMLWYGRMHRNSAALYSQKDSLARTPRWLAEEKAMNAYAADSASFGNTAYDVGLLGTGVVAILVLGIVAKRVIDEKKMLDRAYGGRSQ